MRQSPRNFVQTRQAGISYQLVVYSLVVYVGRLMVINRLKSKVELEKNKQISRGGMDRSSFFPMHLWNHTYKMTIIDRLGKQNAI